MNDPKTLTKDIRHHFCRDWSALCVLVGLSLLIAAAGCTQGSDPVSANLPPVKDVGWAFEAGPRPDLPNSDGSDGTTDPGPDEAVAELPGDETVDAGPDAPMVQWSPPKCTTITGTAAVSFTRDEGATVALRETKATTSFLGGDVVTTALSNTLLATAGPELLKSEDAGCVWTKLADLPGGDRFRLSSGPGDIVWAWTDGGNIVHRVSLTTGAVVPASPTSLSSVVGLSAHRTNADRATLAAQDGRLYVTVDGGASWLATGTAPLALTTAQIAAFHPTDSSRVIVGFVEEGFFLTTDGGASWTQSEGLAELDSGDVSATSVVFAPSNPDVVWAIATDFQQSLEPSKGRHLYRSGDGGATFEVVADNDPAGGVRLDSGGLLAAHPTDATIVYAFFGTPIDSYGSDVYRYSHQTGDVLIEHNDEQGIGGVTFSPADATVMYIVLNFDPASS